MKRPYLDHLTSAKNLETTYEAVRAGFVALALEKNRRAIPFVAEARALKQASSKAATPAGLLAIEEIQPAVLAAAGVSDKAAGHLQDSDKREAINGLLKNYLEPAGANFVEELVFRFLLTRGDTLGGSMRNIGGFIAGKKITRAIIGYMKMSGKSCRWLHSKTKAWADVPKENADIELHLGGLCWQSPQGPRTLVYNRKVPFLGTKGKNVDLCLFNCGADELTRSVVATPAFYVALGELKGGIDPAGADEHWKTATKSLDRVREAFAMHKLAPHTFFVGAAIESDMALEIWSMLERGELENAANLTEDVQIASVARWLCSL